MKKEPKVTAIILAAGASERIRGSHIPKQLVDVNGKYVVCHCLDIFQGMSEINEIVLVIIEDYREQFERLVINGPYGKVRHIVAGGTHRQDSIRNGLAAIKTADFVVIQNAASILTPRSLVSACIKMSLVHKAASAFVSEAYSSFKFKDSKVSEPVDRSTLGHVRDPQVFSLGLIRHAYNQLGKANEMVFTNDVLLLHAQGTDVYLVESPPANIKITSDVDLDLAALLLARAESD